MRTKLSIGCLGCREFFRTRKFPQAWVGALSDSIVFRACSSRASECGSVVKYSFNLEFSDTPSRN